MTFNKVSVTCLCGIKTYTNVFKQHIKSNKKCNLSELQKKELIKILDLKTKHSWGWLISEGEEALFREDFFLSIYRKETKIEDWRFDSPRPVGVMRRTTCQKFSKDRTGAGNPAMKGRKTYNLDEAKIKIKNEFLNIENDLARDFFEIWYFIKSNFKDLLYQLYYINGEYKGRGFSKQHYKLSFLLDIPIEKLSPIFDKRRGLRISKGHDNPVTKEKLSRAASKACKNFSATRPQKILFEMIKSIDVDAILQYDTFLNRKYRVFDVYSPKFDTLIEMHGRIWHSYTKSTEKYPKMHFKVTKNLENDEFKKNIAVSLGKSLVVFWDDEYYNWEEQIFQIFKERPVTTYAEAKSKIYKEVNSRRL